MSPSYEIKKRLNIKYNKYSRIGTYVEYLYLNIQWVIGTYICIYMYIVK